MEDVSARGTSRGHRSRDRRAEAGLSLVEVLIASTLLLIIMLGLVPIFLQSVLNNASGNESSLVSNAARSAAEQYFAYAFDHPLMVVTSGTVNEYPQHYIDRWVDGGRWIDGPSPSGLNLLERTTSIRQFQLLDLEDNGTLDNPFASPPAAGGGVNLYPVHLREIEVVATGRLVPGGALARVLNKTVTVRALRGF